MRKRHLAFGSLGLAMLLLLIYQLGSALLDAASSLGNINVPTAYYGVLSLLFIFAVIWMFFKSGGREI